MTSRIRILDERTINQIAAGEVIENPASVVKELVENSLDADSSSICVEIRSGGRQLIRVSDDGSGMNQDDALLSLERHATSKIRQVGDIHDIHSMGFRGEAIPSIASISKFSLLTSADGAAGTLLLVDGGKLLKCCSAARSQGTTIEVESLFFNTPVRKKFQRAPARDAQDVRSCLEKLALANPRVRFELIHNQERELLLAACRSSRERVEQVLGRDFLSASCPINYAEGELSISGFLGVPSHTRPNRTGQLLFINGRAVHCPAVSFAVKDGYGTRLPTQRYPLFVLQLKLPGERVDVNVHPQKRELRLRQEGQLRLHITTAVEAALRTAGISSPAPDQQTALSVTPRFAMQVAPEATKSADKTPESSPRPAENWPAAPMQAPAAAPCADTKAELELKPKLKHCAPQVLSLVGRYILLDGTGSMPMLPASGQEAEGLLVMDPAAARARVLFEQLKGLDAGSIAQSQGLLVPIMVEATARQVQDWESNAERFAGWGLQAERFGPSTLAVQAIPPFIRSADVADFVRELLEATRDDQAASPSQSQELHLAKLALRAAKRAAPPASLIEAQALVDSWAQSTDPLHCPRGKPTLILIGADEIARRF